MSAFTRASGTWGIPLPDWIAELARRCDARGGSQTKIARELGYSTAVINSVLGNKYTGDLEKVEQKVRGQFLGETVDCPVLNTITKSDCINAQAKPFSAFDPERVRIYRACRSGCPHSRLEADDDKTISRT